MKFNNFYHPTIVSSFCAFLCAVNFTLVVPYMPNMFSCFGYKDTEIAYYVTLKHTLYSTVMIANNIALTLFAYNRVSHKNLTIIILILTSVFLIALSWSINIYCVYTFHSLSAVIMYVNVLGKIIINQHCPKEKIPLSMSIYQSSLIFGLTCGQVIGGFTVELDKQYPHIFNHYYILSSFPYFIPPMVTAILALIAAILTYFLIPSDTAHMIVNKIANNEDGQVQDEKTTLAKCATHDVQYNSVNITILKVGIQDEKSDLPFIHDKIKDTSRHLLDNKTHELNKLKKYWRKFIDFVYKTNNAMNKMDIFTVLRTKHVGKVILIYGVYTGVSNTYVTLFAVFASTSIGPQGLEYSPNEIAKIMLTVSVPTIVLQIYLTPKCVRILGDKRAYTIFCAVTMVGISATPMLYLIHDATLQWIASFTCLLFAQAKGAAQCTLVITISRYLPSHQAGIAYSIMHIINNIILMILPPLAGLLFDDGIMSTIGPPIDVNLPFVAMGFIILLCASLAYSLPNSH